MRALIAAVVLALAVVVPGAAQAPPDSPFEQVHGDGWITSNARFDGTAWHAQLGNRPSFGLQLGEQNDIPYEHGTAGATFWVRDAGCSGAFAAFGNACGWKLATAITQYRSLVVGGNGVEIDGLSLSPPYGRVVNASDGRERRIGLTANIFADWSGADVPTAPRWFAGFVLDRDRFEIARGARLPLSTLVSVDGAGRLSAARLAATRIEQSAPESFATRAHLAGGRFRFVFRSPYQHVPVCVASSEGSAALHVRSSERDCTVISTDPADGAMVNVQVTGDPD